MANSPEQILTMFEIPKTLEHGHLALPVFALAKERRKAPPLIAKEIADQLNASRIGEVEKVEAVAGYVNFHFTNVYFQNTLLNSVINKPDSFAYGDLGKGKKLIIDYASPNVAKPMHIGHLRASVIGQALRNLALAQGFDVIGLNHLGDWGVQFGKLAWAYQNWGTEYPFQEKPFDSLYKMYVRFHEEAEKNPEIETQGSAYFKRLEDGDKDLEKIWKMFVEISLKEYQRLWDILGIQHDLVRGESFYNDRLAAVEKDLEEKGLLKESQGAMIVDLEAEGMPPCLIRKSDGASLYATRDLASALYRMEDLKMDLNITTTDVGQSLHFKQVFKVLEKMGYPWVDRCLHISFGYYQFKGEKVATRSGKTVFLEDVLIRAIELVREIIEKKNPDLENKEKIAQEVGVGAIIFNDLMNDRNKNVDFDWDRVLNFDGDSGPYVQYCQVRCRSILKKYGKEVPKQFAIELQAYEERALLKHLMSFDHTLKVAFQNYKPNLVAQYLLDLCQVFNAFYHKCRILGEGPDIEKSRITLVYLTQKVFEKGLGILNISSPEAM